MGTEYLQIFSKVWRCSNEMDVVKIVITAILISIMTILAAVNKGMSSVATAIVEYRNINNSSTGNSVSKGDNLVPFSTVSNLSSGSPHPIRADCFLYGYVASNKPLGDLLIIKYRSDGSCNPTIELFTILGRVLGILPASGDPLKLGYDGLIFIKYIETPPTATSVVH
jgi:hypothetical protein